MIPKGKCLVVHPDSNVIVMENLDMYEIYHPEDGIESNPLVRKLDAKSTIDFKSMYGVDSSKANWCNEYLPVDENLYGELVWDY